MGFPSVTIIIESGDKPRVRVQETADGLRIASVDVPSGHAHVTLQGDPDLFVSFLQEALDGVVEAIEQKWATVDA